MTIKILINGAQGRMGQVTQATLNANANYSIVATTDKNDDLSLALNESGAEIAIDFTTPHTVFENAKTIIKHRVRPIIGTTGLTLEQIATLKQLCQKDKLGGIIAPNFSMGAVLMMKYAADAARYLKDVEIIEMHHPQKLDAPSGTALKTAQMITENRDSPHLPENEHHAIARGEYYQNIHIHSVRLPGLFSSQSVIFGDEGELLTIRHDGMNRSCCQAGIILACRKVMELDHLVYGLENILD